MPRLTDLPPELLARLVSWCPPPALAALCRTNRALRAAAEPSLYARITFTDPAQLAHPRATAHVRTLTFWPGPRAHVPSEWYDLLHATLTAAAPRLERLVLMDVRAWPRVPFPRLVSARLQLNWGTDITAFVAAVPTLEELSLTALYDEWAVAHVAFPRGVLRRLRVYEGPLELIATLDPLPPLTHVRARFKTADRLELLPRFALASKTLRSLSLLCSTIGPKVSAQLLELVAIHCPQVVYLGLICLSCKDRNPFHRSLTALHSLRILDIDLTTWAPQPHPQLQRPLAMELRTFCPTLQSVKFWVGVDHHFTWTVYASDDENEIDEWEHEHEQPYTPLLDVTWKHI